MEQGYIKIKENKDNQLIVEAKLVNYTLWMTKHKIADLFKISLWANTFEKDDAFTINPMMRVRNLAVNQ